MSSAAPDRHAETGKEAEVTKSLLPQQDCDTPAFYCAVAGMIRRDPVTLASGML